ncbi:MAG TPA: hypothetical protein VKX49_22785 [Bryobacteraceae bacterium]|nr:hypothetical protein [Bryobacteraceae bacterium]
MAKKISRRLVIDASVARSATMSNDSTSTACREFLQEVLRVCHRVVLTPEIEQEWQYAALQLRSTPDLVRARFLVGGGSRWTERASCFGCVFNATARCGTRLTEWVCAIRTGERFKKTST